jgi:hypothetical protein
MEAPDGKSSPNLSFSPVDAPIEWTQMSKTLAVDRAAFGRNRLPALSKNSQIGA